MRRWIALTAMVLATLPPAAANASSHIDVAFTFQGDLYRWSGQEPERLTQTPATESNPEFSEDGLAIVFERSVSGGNSIVILDLANDTEQVVVTGGIVRNPTFSPDGGSILFGRRVNGYDLFTKNLTTGAEKLVAGGPGVEFPGAWGPGGILFNCDIGICGVNPDGSQRRTIVPKGSDPCWIDDERFGYTCDGAGGTTGLCEAEATGAAHTRC